MNRIAVFSRNVYGEQKIYVADPEQAAALETLTGNRTLTDYKLDALRNLGFKFDVVADPASAVNI
jgi:hypothetical protein